MFEQTISEVEQGLKRLLDVVEQLRADKLQLSEQLQQARAHNEKLELSLMEQEDRHSLSEQRMHALLGLIKDAADANPPAANHGHGA